MWGSTDDRTIKSISEGLGVKVIDRPAEFATDESPSEDALLHFAGMVDFDNISVKGKGEGGTGKEIATSSTVSADPLVAYGSISIGYKF